MLVREKIKITLTPALYLDIWVASKCINMIQIYISSISKIAQRVTNTNKVYWMQTIILIDILCIGCQYRYRFLITFQLFINSDNQLTRERLYYSRSTLNTYKCTDCHRHTYVGSRFLPSHPSTTSKHLCIPIPSLNSFWNLAALSHPLLSSWEIFKVKGQHKSVKLQWCFRINLLKKVQHYFIYAIMEVVVWRKKKVTLSTWQFNLYK